MFPPFVIIFILLLLVMFIFAIIIIGYSKYHSRIKLRNIKNIHDTTNQIISIITNKTDRSKIDESKHIKSK